jgi:hypothetical protein
MGSVGALVVIGLGFSVPAALAAFFISYEEWSHHYPTRREPLRLALRAAVAAFVVFALLTVLVSALLRRFV